MPLEYCQQERGMWESEFNICNACHDFTQKWVIASSLVMISEGCVHVLNLFPASEGLRKFENPLSSGEILSSLTPYFLHNKRLTSTAHTHTSNTRVTATINVSRPKRQELMHIRSSLFHIWGTSCKAETFTHSCCTTAMCQVVIHWYESDGNQIKKNVWSA